MATLRVGKVNLYEYLEYWCIDKKKRPNISSLLPLFPHLDLFIEKKQNEYEEHNNNVGTNKLLKRTLLINKFIHPSDLLLNYLLLIDNVAPSTEQLAEYKKSFGGFNKFDRDILFVGWIPLDFFGYAKPFIDIEALGKLPINTTLTYVGNKSVRLFNLITYYDPSSGLYKTERLINQIFLERWTRAKYLAFDSLGVINIENSIFKRVFQGKVRNRLYLKVQDKDGNNKLLSVMRTSKGSL